MIGGRDALLFLLLLQGLACESPDPEATSTVRDSAGVQIVESFAPEWGEGEAWRVDTMPEFDLGAQSDAELFRLMSPRVLSDGRMVVFNGGLCQVRVYDEGTNPLGSWGRCGEGPGEFDEFASIYPWPGDSVLVVDQFPGRVSVFDHNGVLARTAPVPASGDLPIPFVRGILTNGTFVLAGMRDPVGRTTPGIAVAQLFIGLVPTLDQDPHLLGIFPGGTWQYSEFRGRLGRDRLAFGSSTQIAAGSEELYVGLPDRFEIQVYAADGSISRIIRRAYKRVAVTRADIDWLMNRRLDQVDGAEAQRLVRQGFRDLRHAETMPAFGVPVWPGGAEGGPSLLADEVGNLWVFGHYRPGEYQNLWTVLSQSGFWLGDVALPEGFKPSQIGRNFVVGVWTDVVGFAHVRRFRLIKP